MHQSFSFGGWDSIEMLLGSCCFVSWCIVDDVIASSSWSQCWFIHYPVLRTLLPGHSLGISGSSLLLKDLRRVQCPDLNWDNWHLILWFKVFSILLTSVPRTLFYSYLEMAFPTKLVCMGCQERSVYTIHAAVIPLRGTKSSQPTLQTVDLWSHPE